MRVYRYATKQGHPVPDSIQSARGPFPPELYRSGPVIVDYEPQPDGGGEPVHKSGTAQNNFRPGRTFRCKLCKEILIESELEDHYCEEIDLDEVDLDDDIEINGGSSGVDLYDDDDDDYYYEDEDEEGW